MAVGRAPRKADSGVVNVNMNAVVRSSEFKGRKRERERMRKVSEIQQGQRGGDSNFFPYCIHACA